ncbi:MAG: hypothetical protein ACTSR0_01575 [Candidatus Asgardarchaeia archaeon]
MEVCIVYDTKRENGATKTIVKWMAKTLSEIEGVKVDVKRVHELESMRDSNTLRFLIFLLTNLKIIKRRGKIVHLILA